MKVSIKNPALMSLTAVIAIGSTALVIILLLMMTGIDLMQNSLHEVRYNETFAGADGCVEEALMQVRDDRNYTGGTITIGSVDCTMTVNRSGNDVTLNIDAVNGIKYVSDIDVGVDVGGLTMVMNYWDEVY